MTELSIAAVMVLLVTLAAVLSRRVRAEEIMTGLVVTASIWMIFAVLFAYIPVV